MTHRYGLRYFFLGVQSWLPFESVLTVPPPSTQALKLAAFDLLPLTLVTANAPLIVIAKVASAKAIKIALVILILPSGKAESLSPLVVSRCD
jgi:hypothetical protein